MAYSTYFYHWFYHHQSLENTQQQQKNKKIKIISENMAEKVILKKDFKKRCVRTYTHKNKTKMAHKNLKKYSIYTSILLIYLSKFK